MADSPFSQAFPIKTDYTLSGPAAGAFANEALGAWRDAKERSDLSNDLDYANRKLDYETKVKDVPLKDAQRENAISKEEVIRGLYDKGLINDQAVAESKAAISKAAAQMSDDQKKIAEDKSIPWSYAAAALDPKFSPQNAAKYATIKDQLQKVWGITLPDTYDENTHNMIMSKGQMSGLALKHFYDMDKQTAHDKTLLEIAKIGDEKARAVATTNAGARFPDDNKAQLAQVRQAAFSPQGADPNDILRAYQAHAQSQKDKVDQDVEKRVPDVASALTRMKATDPSSYAMEAGKVNMPPSADPTMVARAQVYQEIQAKEIQNFALSFAGGKVRGQNGLVPITPAVVGQIVGQRISQASKPMPGQVPMNRGGNPPPAYGSGAPPVSQAPTPSVAYGSEGAAPASSVTAEDSSAVAPVQTTQKRQVELAPDGSPMTPGQFPGQVATMSNGDVFVWKDKKWVRTQGPAKK